MSLSVHCNKKERILALSFGARPFLLELVSPTQRVRSNLIHIFLAFLRDVLFLEFSADEGVKLYELYMSVPFPFSVL